MSIISITLNETDLKLAADVGRSRNASQRVGNRADGKVLSDSIGIDVQGAQAELAVSRALNLPWDGKFKELEKWFDWRENGHDVSGLEVRSTHHVKGSLILHPQDKDQSPYVLVLTYKSPEFILAGWNFGFVGKERKYWRDVGYGRPCYYLPQKMLRPMDELFKQIRGAA